MSVLLAVARIALLVVVGAVGFAGVVFAARLAWQVLRRMVRPRRWVDLPMDGGPRP